MVELMKPSRARQQPKSFRRRGGDCDQSGERAVSLRAITTSAKSSLLSCQSQKMQMPSTTSVLFADESFVLGKCDYFIDVQLWPLTERLNPRRWLSNFLPAEKPFALHLLNAFTYFNHSCTEQLFLRAFQGLSRTIRTPFDSLLTAKHKWRLFLDTVIVTCVRGENPNPTDSGMTFLRMARQVLGIAQNQIMEPNAAILELRKHPDRPVVFLDDFVGSGNQFITTWNAEIDVEGGASLSFARLSSLLRNASFYYCPLICTSYGKTRISAECKKVILEPAHLVGEEYSAISYKSVIWPPSVRLEAIKFLETASQRAGLGERWRGFRQLGLALAFEHSVPDATLPIFYHKTDTWKPLIERT
jgi:hypothetical protein